MDWVPAPSVDNSRAVQTVLIALSGEWKITDQLTMNAGLRTTFGKLGL